MNLRFIVVALAVTSTLYLLATTPLWVLSTLPGLLTSYWVWRDGRDIERLRADISYLMKKNRE